MKVGELKKILRKCNNDAEIAIKVDRGYYCIHSIDIPIIKDENSSTMVLVVPYMTSRRIWNESIPSKGM